MTNRACAEEPGGPLAVDPGGRVEGNQAPAEVECPSPGPGPINHLIITVHGIRTKGDWQDELEVLLGARPGLQVCKFTYGYFSAVAFLIPVVRWIVAGRFRRWVLPKLHQLSPDVRVDIVAHSFGTYLVAKSLPYLPANRKIGTIIFAGSVLKPAFPWYIYTENGRVGRVINECGTRDNVLVLNQFVALFMGMAGRVGFNGIVGERFMNRYHPFNHGQYFQGDFMREEWIPVLLREATPRHVPDPRKLGPIRGALEFLLNNTEVFKLGSVLAIVLAIILVPRWAIAVKHALNEAEFNASVGRVANAAYLPKRDPRHVRDVLQRDIGQPLDSLDEAEGPNHDEPSAAKVETRVTWYQLPFMWLYRREEAARKAMDYHARANRELMADAQGTSANQERADDLYSKAEEEYQTITDLTPGAYALCLLDHARLLGEAQRNQEALDKFKALRALIDDNSQTSLFKGQTPRSLMVDALCFESDVWSTMSNWGEAENRLADAVTYVNETKSPPDDPKQTDELLALIFTKTAWFHMKLFSIAQAERYFEMARERCVELVESNRFTYKLMLFHVQHGLAMARRYRGQTDEAIHTFKRLIADIRADLADEDKFNAKQRQDLRDRLVNSQERLADCYLYGGLDLANSSSFELMNALANASDSALRGTDDEGRVRVLYKRYIAEFLNRFDRYVLGAPPDLKEARSFARDAIREADSAYAGLTPGQRRSLVLYKDVATFCGRHGIAIANEKATRRLEPDVELAGQDAAIPSEKYQSAREDLRARIRGEIEDLSPPRQAEREKIEMALLASEILIKCGQRDIQELANDVKRFERDSSHALAMLREDDEEERWKHESAVERRKQELNTERKKLEMDATIMLELAGSTIKGSSHPELQDYVHHYNVVAMKALTPAPSKRHGEAASPRMGGVDALAGNVLFHLRLGPGRTLTLIAGKGGLEAPAVPDERVLADERGNWEESEAPSFRSAMKPVAR